MEKFLIKLSSSGGKEIRKETENFEVTITEDGVIVIDDKWTSDGIVMKMEEWEELKRAVDEAIAEWVRGREG